MGNVSDFKQLLLHLLNKNGDGQTKPYQIKQFLEIIEKYNIQSKEETE